MTLGTGHLSHFVSACTLWYHIVSSDELSVSSHNLLQAYVNSPAWGYTLKDVLYTEAEYLAMQLF